jgi:hypothetical protein
MARVNRNTPEANKESEQEAKRTLGEEGLARDSYEPVPIDKADHVELKVLVRGDDRDGARQMVENYLVGSGAAVSGHGDIVRADEPNDK